MKPVIAVVTEAIAGDRRRQIAMGRGDYAHIAALRMVAANALKHALLQYAQQLDLHRHAHVADLVEEKRATLGQFKPPLAGTDRTGERALLVAEHFALQDRMSTRLNSSH